MNQNKRMNGNHCKKDAFFVQFYIVILTKNNLKKIQHCAELRAKGDLTLNERMEMLTVHRESLNVQIKTILCLPWGLFIDLADEKYFRYLSKQKRWRINQNEAFHTAILPGLLS